MQQNNSRIVIFILLLLTLGVISLRGLIQTPMNQKGSREPVNFYASIIPTNRSPLQLLWSKKDVFFESGTSHFCSNGKYLIFAGSTLIDRITTATTIDLSSGETERQFEPGYFNSVACDDNEVYFGLQSDLSSMDVETGQINWNVTYSDLHNPSITNGESNFYVYTIDGLRLSINKVNGQVVDIGQFDPSRTVFLAKKNTEYSFNSKSIVAEDILINQVVWKRSFNGVDFSPIAVGDSIFVYDAKSKILSKINLLSGNIAWERKFTSDKFLVGSFYADQEYVYYLDSQANFVILNDLNGEDLFKMPFKSDKSISTRAISTGHDHFVYAVGNQILIYFDDSLQLFAFEFIQPEAWEVAN